MKKKCYCIECHKKLGKQAFLLKTKRCHSCEMKKRHAVGICDSHKSNYKGGLPKCLDCDNIVSSRNTKRCSLCYYKYIKSSGMNIGDKNGMFKHGKYSKNTHYFCEDCGKEIFNVEAHHCKSCAKKGNRNNSFGKIAHQITGSYYKNIWMRSTWETLFAQFLDLSGIKWLHESKRFYFENCSYCPDFYIPEWKLYIEIKGWFHKKAIKKFKLFKKNYPKENIKIFMKEDLKEFGVLNVLRKYNV